MIDSVSIRLATASEKETLEALQFRASIHNPGDREAVIAHPDAIVLPFDQIEAGQVFVAEDSTGVLGFSAVLVREDGSIDLDGLFVEPGIWGRGIGRRLVEYSCDYARAKGALTLHVIGNPHAKGFYAACGFETTGIHQTRFGVGLSMQRRL